MVFRVIFLVAASASAFALAHVSINSSRRRIPSTKNPKNDGCSFQHEHIQEKDEFQDSNVESRKEEEVASDRPKNAEIELLKNLVKELEQRRVISHVKLLKLHGLRKQQYLEISRLQNDLDARKAEIDMLNVTVNELQTERKILHEEIKQNLLAEKQLEIARKRIVEMEEKLHVEDLGIKGKLMTLKEQVCGIQMEETTAGGDVKVENRLLGMKDLEMEVVKRKRRNKELQWEKRDLSVKLEASQARITALSNMTEGKIVLEIKTEISRLRLSNKELSKRVDRLQKERFGMVEELMYQRWLNACMRFEVNNSKYPQREMSTPRNHLSKKVTKRRHSDSSLGHCISSNVSSFKSYGSTSSTIGSSSSSSQTSVPKKSSLIHKVKRWGRRVSFDDSVQKAASGFEVMPESVGRGRRVSFDDDSVKNVASGFEVMPKSMERVLENEEPVGTKRSISKVGGEEFEFSPPTMDLVKGDGEKSEAISKREVVEEPRLVNEALNEKQVGAQNLVNLLVAAIFFLFLLWIHLFVS